MLASGRPPLRGKSAPPILTFMARPGGPSGDDRPPDPFADGPGDESPLAESVLDADVLAYRKELRRRRRRQRVDRLLLGRYWRPYGISGPILIAVLVVIGSVGGLLLALLPNAQSREPHAAPLATDATAVGSVGSVGGLLPNRPVDVDGTTESVQELRPGVLALVPPSCGCASTIDNVAGQTHEFALHLYVVSDDVGDPQLSSLVNAASGTGTPVYDNGGALRHMYQPKAATGVTVVLVDPHGVVKHIVPAVTAQTPLRALALLDPAA
jgi:hypothetical protein